MKKKLVTAITVIIFSANVAYPVYACTPTIESLGVTTSPDVKITLSDDIKEKIDTAAKNAAADVKIEIKSDPEHDIRLNDWIAEIKKYRFGGAVWKKN